MPLVYLTIFNALPSVLTFKKSQFKLENVTKERITKL